MTSFRFAGAGFDLDGTLVQSEHIHRQSWVEPLAELGITVDEDAYLRDFAGKPGLAIIRDHIGLDGDAAIALYEKVSGNYWRLAVDQVEPTHGLLTFLDRIGHVPKAVCTSAERESALRMLDQLDLTPRFDAIVTASDVTCGKPDPEPFLLAAERIGIAPERCIAFEDSTNGLLAAGAAGMERIGIGPAPENGDELAGLWIMDFADPALDRVMTP
jgi:HAD superfamily hydrolase (TIGR01509 family)